LVWRGSAQTVMKKSASVLIHSGGGRLLSYCTAARRAAATKGTES
jgi:hypothetical protein